MNEPAVPESRAYRHVKCQQETEISGQAFETASNPMSDMERTWCTTCNSFFPITDFEWTDTGETIADYYARYNSSASPAQKFLVSKKMMIIMAIAGFFLGSIGGALLFWQNALWLLLFMTPMCGLFGVFGAMAIYISIICKSITKKVCGVTDTRVLK
jgi:hypothetical protein